MPRQRTVSRKIVALLLLALPPFGLAACLNVKPKVLGQQGKFDFSAYNTSGSSSFKVNFAYFDSSRAANVIYLQGNTNAKSTLVATCNYAGTGCVCKFLDASGNALATTSSTQISYDDPGNYFRCTYSGARAISEVTSVSLQSLDGVTSTGPIAVNTPANLTLTQLIGSDLDTNHVRRVSRYECRYNYLQKAGTTTQGFDCTNAATACETGDGDASNNFCLLRVNFPFYLYASTYSSNFSQKPSDKVYGTQAGLCGLQIKQYDCVGASSDVTQQPWGTPVVKFGLYDQLQGIWQTSVQLPAGPDQAAVSYGFAAPASTVSQECPPGLIKQILYTSNVVSADIGPSHNIPLTTLMATEVQSPSQTPSAVQIHQIGHPGGQCNGSACTLPLSENTAFSHLNAYTSTGQTVFCAIPPTLLSE